LVRLFAAAPPGPAITLPSPPASRAISRYARNVSSEFPLFLPTGGLASREFGPTNGKTYSERFAKVGGFDSLGEAVLGKAVEALPSRHLAIPASLH
jgi:hypothetical protein